MKSETKASQETVLNPSLQRELRGTVATQALPFHGEVVNPLYQTFADDTACALESYSLSREDYTLNCSRDILITESYTLNFSTHTMQTMKE